MSALFMAFMLVEQHLCSTLVVETFQMMQQQCCSLFDERHRTYCGFNGTNNVENLRLDQTFVQPSTSSVDYVKSKPRQSGQFYLKAKPKTFQYVMKFLKDPENLEHYWDNININGGASLVLPTRMETQFVETISYTRLQCGLVELVNAKDSPAHTMPVQESVTNNLSCKHFVSLG